MADDKPSNRFESEVLRLLQTVIVKVDGLKAKVEQNSSDIRSIDNKLTLLSNQFSDVDIMAINDHARIGDLEKRVDILEADIH